VELESGRVRPVGLSFESETAHPAFSEDGRHLVLQERRSQGRTGLQVYDLDDGGECGLDGRKARDKFLNFSEPWFSPKGDRLRPKQLPPRIGEASSDCGKVRYYSVAEFMEKFPDQSHYSEMALQKGKGE
jgi:hypothetical protein